jgi:hypothetical protein
MATKIDTTARLLISYWLNFGTFKLGLLDKNELFQQTSADDQL